MSQHFFCKDKFGQVASSIISLEVASQEGEDTLLVDDENNIETYITLSKGDFGSFQDIVILPQIAIADTQITDSRVGRELVFKVTLDDPSDRTVTVDYETADSSAIAGEDYIGVNGTVKFKPGETEQTIVVNTTGTSY